MRVSLTAPFPFSLDAGSVEIIDRLAIEGKVDHSPRLVPAGWTDGLLCLANSANNS
jgi:hypothetical protein